MIALDKKVYESHEAFHKVPEFKGYFKPKNHFASHASTHTLRGGPMREYWTYSYEAFHQRVKHISRGSNWRNVAKRIMRYWCFQFMYLNSLRDDTKERARLSNLA